MHLHDARLSSQWITLDVLVGSKVGHFVLVQAALAPEGALQHDKEVVQLYRSPGLSASATKTLVRKVSIHYCKRDHKGDTGVQRQNSAYVHVLWSMGRTFQRKGLHRYYSRHAQRSSIVQSGLSNLWRLYAGAAEGVI